MVALLLTAGALGLDNFAASIAIGLAGVDRRMRTRIALAFGAFEAGVPAIGLLIGRGLAHDLGSSAHVVGGLLLIGVGLNEVVATRRAASDEARDLALASSWRLVVLAAGLSIDNLIVGFALGADRAGLIVSIAVIATFSVGLTLAGLELGSRLGERFESRSELIGGAVLIAVGAALLAGVF